jgi:hypothetical protein
MVKRFALAFVVAVSIAVALHTGNPLHALYSFADEAIFACIWFVKVPK